MQSFKTYHVQITNLYYHSCQKIRIFGVKNWIYNKIQQCQIIRYNDISKQMIVKKLAVKVLKLNSSKIPIIAQLHKLNLNNKLQCRTISYQAETRCRKPSFSVSILNGSICYGFSSSIPPPDSHKYANKTTKEIEKQMSEQKWKDMQNSFKSISSTFNLKRPTMQQLNNQKQYPKPKKMQYSLQTLRECSHIYPVHLYWQLEKKKSPFNQVVEKVVDNLWKAEKKQLLEFLDFLYAWDYKHVNVESLYEIAIQRFELSMGELFSILKKYDPTKPKINPQSGQIHKKIQLKTIQRLYKSQIEGTEYGDLLRIINFFTVKEVLTEQFYKAVVNIIKNNINSIKPKEVLESYIYFTYNLQEHIIGIKEKQQQSEKQQKQPKEAPTPKLSLDILQILQTRMLSPQCLPHYSGQQQIAILHTFLKNNLILNNKSETNREQYHAKVEKIVSRIQLSYYTADFRTRDKINLLGICSMLPEVKRQLIIGLMQNQLYKRNEKFDYKVLPQLYVVSHQNNVLSQQMRAKIQQNLIQKLLLLQRKDVSRILWIATITNSNPQDNAGRNRLNLMHKKVETIIEGGLKEFQIKDVSIIVWSLCSDGYKLQGKFWGNLEDYLVEELARCLDRIGKQTAKGAIDENKRKLINDCCWILWAYHNNQQLRLQTINMISNILISWLSPKIPSQTPSSPSSPSEVQIQQQNLLTPFQLSSIIAFFYSINPPDYQHIIAKIKQLTFTQFTKIYPTMQSIQLCKCLKYIGLAGSRVWADKQIYDGILMIFQGEADTIHYRDIMTVVAVLVGSGLKTKRVVNLIVKLMERKKRLESLEKFGTQELQSDSKRQNNGQSQKSKWKFPI